MMNKQQIVEILKYFGVSSSADETIAEEILALRKDEIPDGDYTRVKASALRKLKEQARQPIGETEHGDLVFPLSSQWQPGVLEEEKEKCGDFDCFACYPSQRIGDEPV